jgi:hypothetical protein
MLSVSMTDMTKEPTVVIQPPKKHHIDIEKNTVNDLKFLKAHHRETYDDVIQFLIKQTKNHQKCLRSKNKK